MHASQVWQIPPQQQSKETIETLASQAWLAPKEDVYFFCDLHADADAFLRSLKLSKLITQDSNLQKIALTDLAETAKIVIGGDCIDKGPSNLQLLNLIAKLYQTRLNIVLLAGNHDMRLYAGLLALGNMQDVRQSHFFIRMGRKTASFLHEIYTTYCQNEPELVLPESTIRQHMLPSKSWYQNFPEYAQDVMSTKAIAKELSQIKKKQTDFRVACEALGMTLNQVYQAALKAKQLFTEPDGDFFWFFDKIELLYLSGSYLFCHAGIDDNIAAHIHKKGIQTINRTFKNQLKKGLMFQMYYSEYGNVFRTKYRNKDWPLTQQGEQLLKSMNIFALVNGHRSHESGQQLCLRQGILHFECDTQLNANCRKKSNMQHPGEAVTIFHQDGSVQAFSSELEIVKTFDPKCICA